MISAELVRAEAGQYQVLASQLRADFEGIDEEMERTREDLKAKAPNSVTEASPKTNSETSKPEARKVENNSFADHIRGLRRSVAARASLAPSRIATGSRIDKSRLVFGATQRRFRDKQHLRRVAELPCLVCNRQPSHAHHLRFAQKRGMGQKVSDEFVVPLCSLHHGALHQSSAEQEWWSKQGLDPLPVAAELWTRHRAEVS